MKRLTSCTDTDKLITAAITSYLKRKDCASESSSMPVNRACANSQDDEIHAAYDNASASEKVEPSDTLDDENVETI